jgi:hypothetical protein
MRKATPRPQGVAAIPEMGTSAGQLFLSPPGGRYHRTNLFCGHLLSANGMLRKSIDAAGIGQGTLDNQGHRPDDAGIAAKGESRSWTCSPISGSMLPSTASWIGGKRGAPASLSGPPMTIISGFKMLTRSRFPP